MDVLRVFDATGLRQTLLYTRNGKATAYGGASVTPDIWDRLEADRRQALEDDLEWIRRGRKG